MKKLFAVLVALTLVLSMGTIALAAEGDTTTGTITIYNTIAGEKYTIYKMLSFVPVAGSTNSGRYTVEEKWADFIANAADDEGVAYLVTDTETGTIIWNGEETDERKAELAKLAVAYAKDPANAITGTTIEAEGNKVVFENVPLGYYAVDTTLGALCALTNTNNTADVKEKNSGGSITKEVKENSATEDKAWGKTNDASIGDTVEYRATITTGKGTSNYVMHDTMSKGLTFNNDVKVFLNGTEVEKTNYVVESTVNDDGTTIFTVDFTVDFEETLKENEVIVVTYSATLNEKAVIAGEGNPNEVYLTYGNNQETNKDVTVTYTYQFQLVKTDANDTLLPGATFKLYDAKTGGNEIPVVKVSDGVYRVAVEGETGVLIEAGYVTIRGLDSATYYLEEIDAPAGYNKIAERKEVTINGANNDATLNESNVYQSGGVQVVNKTGTLLPETGGIGTTIFYIVGIALMLGAAIILVSKKRMASFA